MSSERDGNVGGGRKELTAFVFAMGLCVLLAIIFGAITFAKDGHNDKIEPMGTINPNEASAVSLSRLPGIGVGRANAIIEYRQQGAAFADCNDLDKVKGIGPATVKKIREWVEFK